MSCYLTSLFKSEDPKALATHAQNGVMLGYPVKIGGQTHRSDNGVPFHSSIKVFDEKKDHLHKIHDIAQHLPLNPPDAKNTQIEPGEFPTRDGGAVYVLKLSGNSADKIKEHNGKFAHMGNSQPYEYQAHISIPKELHDQIKAAGHKTAADAGIEFGQAELKHGPKVIKIYNHKPDTHEPVIPDDGDISSKIPLDRKMPKLVASEKSYLCPLHKSDSVPKALQSDEDAHTLMNRKEDKYFLPRRFLERIVSELSDRFALGDIDTDTRYSRNRTIYLDDKDLSSMRDCVSKITPRTKVRIRQYSPNNQGWEQVAYAEFKVKEDGQTKKIRVRIPATLVDSLSEGGQIPFSEGLVNINRDLDRHVLESRVRFINHTITRKGLRKQIELQYERRAYSGKNLRITIDDDLNFFDARDIDPTVKAAIDQENGWGKFIKPYLFAAWENPLILEVKSGDDVPKWLSKLLDEVGAEKTPFSKYAAGMITHLKSNTHEGKVLSTYEEKPTDMVKSEEECVKEPLKPLMKPWVSQVQAAWGNSPAGKEALGSSGVKEWNDATKGKKLPKKVAKTDKVCMPKKDFVEEHEDLVDVLKHPSKKKIDKEIKEQSEELEEQKLEKGALKNASIALGMAGALAGGHTVDAGKKAPHGTHQQAPKADYDHGRMLRAIASVESGNNSKVKHSEGGGDIHGSEHAYGKYGIMPETVRETVKGHKDLNAKHGKVVALHGKQLHNYMRDHKGLEDVIASRHLQHLEHKVGKSPDHLAYGWLNGTAGAMKAQKEHKDISNHWHVQKVRDAYKKVK